MAISRIGRRWLAVALLLTGLFGAAVLAAAYLYFIVPRLEARWANFGIDLPAGAVVLIRMSHALIRWLWVLIPFGVASLLALIVVWFVVGMHLLRDVPEKPPR
jgi:type II secretory pathway component PulF